MKQFTMFAADQVAIYTEEGALWDVMNAYYDAQQGNSPIHFWNILAPRDRIVYAARKALGDGN